jgi:ankyrin repeat protein
MWCGDKMITKAADIGNKELDKLLISEIIGGRCTGDRVIELVGNGADVNAKNVYGRSALAAAAFYGNVEVVKALKELGADANLKSNDGSTAMHEAAQRGGRGNIEVVRLLKGYGCEINQFNRQWMMPIHYAVLNDDSDMIRTLHELGANIYAYNGFTLLEIASRHDNLNAIATLNELYALDRARLHR